MILLKDGLYYRCADIILFPICLLQKRRNGMGIISLKYDFSFKNLMLNEEVRKYFVSDVLGIPAEEIQSVRLCNPFLWKRYFRQKQGILDVLLEMNENSKINIELQIRRLKHWDRRNLFYLAKIFTEDSDLLELHIIELGKELTGTERVDDWIRLFNAKTEGEIAMIQRTTANPGITIALGEVKKMSLSRKLRVLYEVYMKEIRDKKAREDYVRDEGIALGKAEDIIQLLAELGTVPEELKQIVQAEKDIDTLNRWHKLAAKSETLEKFRTEANL